MGYIHKTTTTHSVSFWDLPLEAQQAFDAAFDAAQQKIPQDVMRDAILRNAGNSFGSVKGNAKYVTLKPNITFSMFGVEREMFIDMTPDQWEREAAKVLCSHIIISQKSTNNWKNTPVFFNYDFGAVYHHAVGGCFHVKTNGGKKLFFLIDDYKYVECTEPEHTKRYKQVMSYSQPAPAEEAETAPAEEAETAPAEEAETAPAARVTIKNNPFANLKLHS